MNESIQCNTVFDRENVTQLQPANPHLKEALGAIVEARDVIIRSWVRDPAVESLLNSHNIEASTFASRYANEVFNYFIGVIGGVTQMGDCPIMATFLTYLKDRNVTSDELFTICSHFRMAMLEYLCGTDYSSGRLFAEITYIFDRNFSGVLKMYSGRLYEKEMELAKNIKLLEEYKNAIDESSIVSRTDENGVITYVNDKFVEICGYSREELIGQRHNIVRHEETPTDFFETLWETIRSRRIYQGTMKNRRKSGESYYMDLTIVPIYDPVKEATEYVGIGYEVTRLVEAREEAEMAGAAKEYFLSNMSHEIRTPLNAILGFVSLLMDESVAPRHRHYLDIIYSSGENLLSIINDILDFSKLRSGEFLIERKPFNLHAEIGHTLELFAAGANEKRITLFSFIDPQIPMELIADGLRMNQIVANLLSNAIKFTPVGGCIDILVQLEGEELRVLVQDNGIGIVETDREKIFNAFSQGQNYETRIAGGTGLGLSICKKLAEHMGGRIELESMPGRGSCFTLVLPVERVAAASRSAFEPERFAPMRLGLLEGTRRRPEITALLGRYWEVFGFEIVRVTRAEAGCCDLLFFVDSDISELQRREILDSGVSAIAIMEHISDFYEGVPRITPLHFPIYCTKLYRTMNEALEMGEPQDETQGATFKRRFSGHLLVAEDNVANRELMKIILERCGVTYDMVEDGREAVEAYKKGRYDLVLMDEQMPHMNGLEALAAIREYEQRTKREATPIVAITANLVKGVREQRLKAGYAAFVGKPIFPRELEAVFADHLVEREALTRHDAPPPPAKGLNMEKLQQELMLSPEEITMLLGVFEKKLASLWPELRRAALASEYAALARAAHALKGSSANFRLETVQNGAAELELAAVERRTDFDYGGALARLEAELEAAGFVL